MVDTIGQLASAHFLYFSALFCGAVILLSWRVLYPHTWSEEKEPVSLYVLHAATTILLFALYENTWTLLLPVCIASICFVLLQRVTQGFSAVGIHFLLIQVLVYVFGFFWSLWFVAQMEVSLLTKTLMSIGFPFVLVTLPFVVIQSLERYEVLCRSVWRRPQNPLTTTRWRMFTPKVSIHVPIHAEPPEIVLETLSILSQLEYPNFEVLVIDNNTKEESLWKPVELYCKKLGERFRFFHVDPLYGAKAGALNFALRKTAPDAEIIGVVDADYHARPDFLKSLIGYFKDPNMGFVQTPHDYREWEGSAYLRMCYYEYQSFFQTVMVSANERDAAMTVGTMCLIRKQALIDAGGWATWCVTEDSELSIRIHASGYTSVYTRESFGKGLIPETFEGYRKQRYRWIAGPVQEFKRHFSLLFPYPAIRSSALDFFQRLHHFNHGFAGSLIGISALFVPFSLLIGASMAYHQEIVQVPVELWVGVTVACLGALHLSWLLYRVTLDAQFKDFLGALLAGCALRYVTAIASIRTFFFGKAAWHRTNKFRLVSSSARAFSTTKTEIFMGVFLIASAVYLFLQLPVPGLLSMLLVGVVFEGCMYLSAPIVALLAERELQVVRHSERWNAWRFSMQTTLSIVLLIAGACVAYIPSERTFWYQFEQFPHTPGETVEESHDMKFARERVMV